MLPNDYDYRELQKINEHLRRENHLLRLLDNLQREGKGIDTSANSCVSKPQDATTEDAANKSTGDESQGTLVEDVDQKMDVDAHGNKVKDYNDHPSEKKETEMEGGEDGKEEKEEEKGGKEEKEEEEEEEEEDDDEDDDISTWISNCTDEDSKEEDEEIEKEIPEEVHVRELHHCNPRAHRNAVLSLFKRNVLELDCCSTPIDDMHIEMHQDVKDCSSLKPMTVGNCKLDASLYVASDSNLYKRTDVYVYKLLYGLHPAVALWIDYEPTLRLLERHAEMQTYPKGFHRNTKFLGLFNVFITVFEQAGCLSGYLEDVVDEDNSQGIKKDVAFAYKKCVDALD